MEKTAEGVPHGVEEPVPADKPLQDFTTLTIPRKQCRVNQKHRHIQPPVGTFTSISHPRVYLRFFNTLLHPLFSAFHRALAYAAGHYDSQASAIAPVTQPSQ
jgi:hypothetical protein